METTRVSRGRDPCEHASRTLGANSHRQATRSASSLLLPLVRTPASATLELAARLHSLTLVFSLILTLILILSICFILIHTLDSLPASRTPGANSHCQTTRVNIGVQESRLPLRSQPVLAVVSPTLFDPCGRPSAVWRWAQLQLLNVRCATAHPQHDSSGAEGTAHEDSRSKSPKPQVEQHIRCSTAVQRGTTRSHRGAV